MAYQIFSQKANEIRSQAIDAENKGSRSEHARLANYQNAVELYRQARVAYKTGWDNYCKKTESISEDDKFRYERDIQNTFASQYRVALYLVIDAGVSQQRLLLRVAKQRLAFIKNMAVDPDIKSLYFFNVIAETTKQVNDSNLERFTPLIALLNNDFNRLYCTTLDASFLSSPAIATFKELVIKSLLVLNTATPAVVIGQQGSPVFSQPSDGVESADEKESNIKLKK